MMYPSKDAAEARGSMCDPPVNGSHKMGSCWMPGDSHGACGALVAERERERERAREREREREREGERES